jgi:hypothetical protein
MNEISLVIVHCLISIFLYFLKFKDIEPPEHETLDQLPNGTGVEPEGDIELISTQPQQDEGTD